MGRERERRDPLEAQGAARRGDARGPTRARASAHGRPGDRACATSYLDSTAEWLLQPRVTARDTPPAEANQEASGTVGLARCRYPAGERRGDSKGSTFIRRRDPGSGPK